MYLILLCCDFIFASIYEITGAPVSFNFCLQSHFDCSPRLVGRIKLVFGILDYFMSGYAIC